VLKLVFAFGFGQECTNFSYYESSIAINMLYISKWKQISGQKW